MGFYADLGADARATPTSPTLRRGIDVAVEEVDEIITAIGKEMAEVRPQAFRNDGHIAPSSFGGARLAPRLALSHSKAHAVVADTLAGVKEDLQAFRTACTDAKQILTDTDQGVGDRMAIQRRAVDRIVEGSRGTHTEDAHHQARNEHADETIPLEDAEPSA